MSAIGCGAVTSLTPETGPLVGGNPMLVTGLNFGVSVTRHIHVRTGACCFGTGMGPRLRRD